MNIGDLETDGKFSGQFFEQVFQSHETRATR